MTLPNKAQLRRTLRSRRRALSAQQQQQAAQGLLKQLKKLVEFQRARRVASYVESDGEIATQPLHRDCRRRGIDCFLPVIHPQQGQFHMRFHRYRPGQQLRNNRFGIAEPNPWRQPSLATEHFDIIVMPLVGFDRAGRRLGMGGGFYDRALAFCRRRPHPKQRPLLIGLAHHGQEVDRLPCEAWDVPLDLIVTDRAVIRPRHSTQLRNCL